MHQELQEHFEKVLREFSGEEHYQELINAKEEYFVLTGKALEEDEDYESRMSSFNDWYILQFISKEGNRPPIEVYLEKNGIEGELKKSFLEHNHSLFEYSGKSMRGIPVLRDILHDKKVYLDKDHSVISLLKGDIFLGRTLEFEGNNFLMNGMCFLPKEVKSVLKKNAKKVRKQKNPTEEINFLLFVESLKTKWQRYGHIDIEKIFVFPK